jgi:hypothetical protein
MQMWSVPWFHEAGYFGARSLVAEIRAGLHSTDHHAALRRTITAAEVAGDATAQHDELQRFSAFVHLHEPQLATVPRPLWLALFRKLDSESFDAAQALALQQLARGSEESADAVSDADELYLDDDAGAAVSLPAGTPLELVASRALREYEDIFLVEHVWTFEAADEAAMQLAFHPGLLGLVCSALCVEHRASGGAAQEFGAALQITDLPSAIDLPLGDSRRLAAARVAAKEAFKVTGQFGILGGDGATVQSNYLLDTIGCHAVLNATDRTDCVNFALSGAFVFRQEGAQSMQVFSLLWPVAEIAAGSAVLCKRQPRPALSVRDETWASIEHRAQVSASHPSTVHA